MWDWLLSRSKRVGISSSAIDERAVFVAVASSCVRDTCIRLADASICANLRKCGTCLSRVLVCTGTWARANATSRQEKTVVADIGDDGNNNFRWEGCM